MRTVLAGLFVVALAGCLDDVFESLDESGVCVSQGEIDSRCTESPDGSNRARRQCDEETSQFFEGVSCTELDYVELCLDEEDIRVFAWTPEECDAFDNQTGDTLTSP